MYQEQVKKPASRRYDKPPSTQRQSAQMGERGDVKEERVPRTEAECTVNVVLIQRKVK